MSNASYFIDEDQNGFGRCLVLKAPWSDSFIDIIKKNKISVVRLSETAGWEQKNISFLEKLKYAGLRGIEIYAWDVKDITPLCYLPDLEFIGLQSKFTKAPDFSLFKNLTNLFIYWRPKALTVFDCSSLKRLNIVNYPAEDLKELKKVIKLMRLQITSRKLVSLGGIEKLQSLKILDIAECPRLERLSGIAECKELQDLELSNCKKLDNLTELGAFTNLREVFLTDCGKIRSLRPLANSKHLESLFFTGDTNIIDGDLEFIAGFSKLQRLWFADRKHYSHTKSQLTKD